MEARKLGRARRAVGAAAKVAGLGIAFGLAAAGGALLHIGLGAPRRFVVSTVNGVLDGTFKGKVVIRDLGSLGMTHIGGLAVEIYDPEGIQVAHADGVKVRFATVTIVESLLGKGDMKIVLPSVEVENANVTLNVDDQGNLGIARAFDSKTPSPSDPNAKATDVELQSLKVKHLWAHGTVAKGAPVVDADVDVLDGSLSTDPKATKIVVKSLSLKARGIDGKNPVGIVQASVSIPGDKDPHGEIAGEAHYRGVIGDVPLVLDASKKDKRVDATIDVPETDAAAIRALQPDVVTVTESVSLHAEAHGELPKLAPTLHATIGDGAIDLKADVVIPDGKDLDTTVDAHIEAKKIDASVLSKGAPKTLMTATLDSHVVLHPASKIEGTYALTTEAGEAAGNAVPAVSSKGSFTEKSAQGNAHVAEPGAPTDVAFAILPDPKTDKPNLVDVKLTTKVDLAKLQRVKNVGKGIVNATVAAHLDLTTKALQADASGALWGFSNSSLSVKAAAFQASVKGTTEAPRFVLRLDGGGLAASGRTFTGVHAYVFGSPAAISVGATLKGDEPTPSLDARAFVSLKQGTSIQAIRVRVTQPNQEAIATIKSVRIVNGGVKVDGVRIEGLGDPIEASFAMAGRKITAHAKGDDVDLARAAALVGRPEDAKGHLGFDVDLVTDRRTTHGKVTIDGKGLAVSDIKNASVHVGAEIEGRNVKADVRGNLGDAGSIAIAGKDIKLGQDDVLDEKAWLAATGAAALEGTIDLAKLAAALPDVLPVDYAAGVVSLKADVKRDKATDPPVLDAKGSTRGLSLAQRQTFEKDEHGQPMLGPPAFHVEGVDGTFEAHVDPNKDKGSVKLAIADKTGALATFDLAADTPLGAIFKGTATTEDILTKTKLDAKFSIPRREIAALPPTIRDRLPIAGAVSVDGEIKGSAQKPEVSLHVKGEHLLRKGAHKRVQPADVDVAVSYADGRGQVRAGMVYAKEHVLDAAVHVDNISLDLTKGAPDLSNWTAAGDVRLHDFPLAPVASLTGQRMRGKISGAIALRDLHRNASVGADLTLADLVLDETVMPRGFVKVIVKDGDARAGVRLEQKDGVAEVTAKGTVAWGKEIAPAAVAGKALDVHFAARNFRIDAATPFVQTVITELDGRIDSDFRAQVDPTTKKGKAEGSLVIRDGVIEVPAIGERFHKIGAKITMAPWGTVRIDNVQADAPTGHLTAGAQAKLDGFALQGASFAVHINQGEKVPIALEGVPLGSAYGDVKGIALVSADGKSINVNVSVPMLGMQLPQSTGHTVESLDVDDHLRLGVHRGGKFAFLPMGAPAKPKEAPSGGKIHAEVTIGEVRVRRDTTLDVRVTGKPIFDITDKTVASGSIRIKQGQIEVQGKRFKIESGIVTFTGDPANPQVVATAYWDAPDSTRVYADFAGTPKSGKLKLRAEPDRTQDEIIALILFGSSDGQLGGSTPAGDSGESSAAKGAGVAGGTITQGVNKAISGITTVDVTTRVDTSESDNPKPEVVIQLNDRLSAQVAYNMGVPPPGEPTDKTEVTLDWRFYKGWSIDTTVGDEGSTALDLIWRHRY